MNAISKDLLKTLIETVSYVRVSTRTQQTEQQDVGCQKYCDIHSLGEPMEFGDLNISGTTKIWNRPGGGRLYRYLIEHPEVKNMVVLKLDRLGRNMNDIHNAYKFLKERGVVLHIVQFGGCSLSTSGTMGEIMMMLLAGFAQLEVELIQGRIHDRMELKREKGELCGVIPFGWDAVETGEKTEKGVAIREYVVNPDEFPWLMAMVRWEKAGMGRGKIARCLNDNHVPTKLQGKVLKGKGGESYTANNQWTWAKVDKLLNSRTLKDWLAAHPELEAENSPTPKPLNSSTPEPPEEHEPNFEPFDFEPQMGRTVGEDILALFHHAGKAEANYESVNQ